MARSKLEEPLDQRSSRQARGLRLVRLRKLFNLSRGALAQKLKVSAHAIQNWDIEKNNGMSDANAHRLVDLFRQLGVKCTYEWLAHGIEPAPVMIDPMFGKITVDNSSYQPLTTLTHHDKELELIGQELLLFRAHYPDQTLDLLVTDDSMSPAYHMGDYVAGILYRDMEIEGCVGQDCIVQTEHGEILLRYIKSKNQDNVYTLTYGHSSTFVSQPILHEVRLLVAAPVVWQRRRRRRRNRINCS